MPDCTECSRDLSQICEKGHHSGIGQDGFYAPYAAIDIRSAVLVPKGMYYGWGHWHCSLSCGGPLAFRTYDWGD